MTGDKDKDEASRKRRASFENDDEMDDEDLADQLNALADLEDADAGETRSAAVCAAALQVSFQAYTAWDAVGVRRPKGEGGESEGRQGR